MKVKTYFWDNITSSVRLKMKQNILSLIKYYFYKTNEKIELLKYDRCIANSGPSIWSARFIVGLPHSHTFYSKSHICQLEEKYTIKQFDVNEFNRD